jgi:hypothetical protein
LNQPKPSARTSVNGTADPATALEQSLSRVIAWVRLHEYRAYEPADGNLSVLTRLTASRVLPMRVLQQVVLRAPFNVRPFIGIRPHESAIGRGYMAAAYLVLASRDPAGDSREEAVACLDWLVRERSRSSGERDYSWGDPYDYASRGGRRERDAPLLVWTALIGHTFLDAYRALARERYLEVAAGAGRWILALPRDDTATGTCLSYNARGQCSIHNASAIGASFLARLGTLTGDGAALQVASAAMAYTCRRQHSDGGWHYAEDPRYHWIDSFHTGYILSALAQYRDVTGDGAFDEPLRRGRRFYISHFFEPDGRPRYFHDRTDPVDIQCAAQAIETLSTLADDDPSDLPRATRVALWTIANMQNDDGHFDYRRYGRWRVRTPMLHWGQATMAKALAVLLERLASSPR